MDRDADGVQYFDGVTGNSFNRVLPGTASLCYSFQRVDIEIL